MAKGVRGGVWLELKKQPASERPVEVLDPPRILYLPLAQHKGQACRLAVKAGEHVRLGQPLAIAGEGVSADLHAPVSGTVVEISEYNTPEAGVCPMVVLENDGRDTVYVKHRSENPDSLLPDRILDLIRSAALSSAGGLDYPLWAKLADMKERHAETLVINAVETEPYICSSQRLMSESPEETAKGLKLLLRCICAERAVLAVSDDISRQTVHDMAEHARHEGVELQTAHIPPKYPAGYEPYLDARLFGSGRHRVKAGYVFVEECIGTYRAAVYHFPQISRVITVAGDAVGNPQNLEVRLGTPVKNVLEHCGLIYDPERVVLGSPMRGISITDLMTPVTKQVTAVLAFVPRAGGRLKPLCINCGKCVSACPQGLMPNYIAMRAVLADIEACRALSIDRCIECGICAYICPGRMPIVELIKNIKKAGLENVYME